MTRAMRDKRCASVGDCACCLGFWITLVELLFALLECEKIRKIENRWGYMGFLLNLPVNCRICSLPDVIGLIS